MSETRAETVTLWRCLACDIAFGPDPKDPTEPNDWAWTSDGVFGCVHCEAALNRREATFPPPGSVCVVLSEEEVEAIREGLDPECKGGSLWCTDCILFRALSTKEETPDA